MDIEIIEKEIGSVIEIEENVFMLKMPMVMGKGFGKILEYLKSNDVQEIEAPYARYLDIDWETQVNKGIIGNTIDMLVKKWHFMIGFTSPKLLDSKNEMKASHISHCRYVKGMHYGAYQKVGTTYKMMVAWMNENNVSPKGESFEFYLNDPRETKKEELETMILIPLSD